jgi:hypothetical protein
MARGPRRRDREVRAGLRWIRTFPAVFLLLTAAPVTRGPDLFLRSDLPEYRQQTAVANFKV